ncbi:MAG: class I tRNA ligase family protein [Candidatus Moranbacteria bacterium]|nr:class I tRNA ligase family protein [Candidatus Moranbacteria bacterium]
MNENNIPKTYDAKEWENELYSKWEESGLFNPDICIKKNITDETKPTFSIVLPPPNVTGTLHAGHAAMLAIEDTIVRYHRMKGDRTLWIPGTDHAAVATQSKVENILWKEEQKTRFDLGREEFLKRIETFAQQSHDTIVHQTKKMGASLDWSREAYTLDEKRSLSVRTAFKKMYDDGLIYRGYRVVNWTIKGQSTCSDDEVVTIERQAKLYTFRYSKNFPIAIATTRPETKLGDTAIAVHPDDERYKKYIGQTFTADVGSAKPLAIKIIADESVDPAFGTGAVGVTPAHSHADFEMRERHPEIDLIQVIDTDGTMTAEAGQDYAHLTTLEAREKFVLWLRENDLIEKEEDITQNVGTSDRYEDVLEIIPMRQWFVAVNKEFDHSGKKTTLKQLMREAVGPGKITLLPERFSKTYFHWIDNLRDWCISRQIWFGHRIPVWYCLSCKKERINATVKSRWFFVRHGETDWNKKEINAGTTDIPLNETGREQARLTAEKLAAENIGVIFSSHLSRAHETAKIIGKKIGVDEIIIDDRLQERNMGKAEGLSYSETKKRFPDLQKYNGKSANNESYEEAENRIWKAVSEHLEKHSHKNVLITSHGAVLRALWRKIQGVTPESIMNIKRFPNATPLSIDILKPCEYCGHHFFEQDPDTLDTWFSSGLWTFSTLGWPDENAVDFKNYHPTSLLETGYDILFFWVARMILMTEYLLDTHPFDTIYLHGLVRDEQGRKMSKSLGNVIDPLTVSEKYGADALRMALISGSTPGNDLRLSDEKIVMMRNFTNKLWNLARYVGTMTEKTNTPPEPKTDADQYLIKKLHAIVRDITRHLERYELSLAAEELREFTWGDFADWYVEVHKVEKNDALLRYAFDKILKLWHPFMPFVTEAIHQTFHFDTNEFLMIAKWPEFDTTKLEIATENRFELVKGLISTIRNVRAAYHIDPAQKMTVSAFGESEQTLRGNEEIFKRLARIDKLQTLKSAVAPKNTLRVQYGLLSAFLHLDGVVDIAKERARFTKEKDEKEKYIATLEAKLSNKNFIERAKKEIIETKHGKLKESQKQLLDIKNHLASLQN